jgi:hypothetical protein
MDQVHNRLPVPHSRFPSTHGLPTLTRPKGNERAEDHVRFIVSLAQNKMHKTN